MTSFFHGAATVVENILLARDTYRIRLDVPEIARSIRPGQFVMLRMPARTHPLLGRPFALYDTAIDAGGNPSAIDIVYLVVGKVTALLAKLQSGRQVEIWGPLGNTFPDFSAQAAVVRPGSFGHASASLEHVGLVAGGIGQTPFLAYVRQLLGERGYGGRPAQRVVERVSLFYGARTADLLAGVDDFRAAGAAVYLSTDDGTQGFHGFVTELLAHRQLDRPQHLIGCGPLLMMKAVASLARRWNLPCHLSLETPMACGVGLCFSCVTRVKSQPGWDYRRVCVDGPVFDARSLDLAVSNGSPDG
jgi:dihydroorotate dehydrogenase electron transfer subunit